MSNSANVGPKTLDLYKRQTSTNVGLRKKILYEFEEFFLLKVVSFYRMVWLNPKELSSCHLLKYFHLHIYAICATLCYKI